MAKLKKMKITLSTCFYRLHSKFDAQVYTKWATNLFEIVSRFGLVVYTDAESKSYLPSVSPGSPITIIVLPLPEFYNYRYKDYWISNHERNHLLNTRTAWELNMLWAEKISFVQRTALINPFKTDFFGWCDIGYFRNRANDTPTHSLMGWPDDDIVEKLDPTKIHYAQIRSDPFIRLLVLNKNEHDIPIIPIPPSQVSFAGGFFICHKTKIDWWRDRFDKKLHSYFTQGYLVKDDQIIITDCIYSEPLHFQIYTEDIGMDNWFMFQRILSKNPTRVSEPAGHPRH